MGNGHVDQVSARRAKAHRESGNRKSRGHKHYVIVSAKTPIERHKGVVTE
jgi:hypothetical protein